MNLSSDNSGNTIEIAEALRFALAEMPEFASPAARIFRQPSDYRSSFALEEITIHGTEGRRLVLIFKDLDWQSLTPAVRQAKPALLYDPLREIEVYRRVLAGSRLGTARCYAAIADPARPRYWLFLEKAPGAELYQYGPLEVWGDVARWLARFHHDDDIRQAADDAEIRPHFLRYDRAFFRVWVDRAVEFVSRRQGPKAASALYRLARRYDEVAQFLASLPATLIHGEFYASNVVVDASLSPPRVCAIDWELAGIGPAVIDLAALVVGKWTEAQRAELIAAYQSGLPAGHPWAGDCETISHAVDHARLHLAVQWLGWSPEWTPPAAHAQDWLAEALLLGERLDLL
jgi:hypothetical protein